MLKNIGDIKVIAKDGSIRIDGSIVATASEPLKMVIANNTLGVIDFRSYHVEAIDLIMKYFYTRKICTPTQSAVYFDMLELSQLYADDECSRVIVRKIKGRVKATTFLK